jgi:hypothetical protein
MTHFPVIRQDSVTEFPSPIAFSNKPLSILTQRETLNKNCKLQMSVFFKDIIEAQAIEN